jgi:hypothetical protein
MNCKTCKHWQQWELGTIPMGKSDKTLSWGYCQHPTIDKFALADDPFCVLNITRAEFGCIMHEDVLREAGK